MMKLSVVIPTINRAPLLARTIDHIESQTVPKEHYEVIVIDNRSSDHTLEVLQQKAKTYPNLRVSYQQKPGAAATRNVGIRMARGEVVLFVDDDILAGPDLIQAHLGYQKDNHRAAIIGAVATPWGDAQDPFLRYLRDRGIFNPYSLAKGVLDFSYYHTGNVSTLRTMLAEAGGFNEEFSVYGMEDIELGYRLERLGCRMVYAPDAKAIHYYFPTYEQFIERCELLGNSLGKLLSLHPELKRRFVENGKMTRVLKRFHGFYRLLSPVIAPVSKLLVAWDGHRGTGSVMRLLDLHYYWAIRYHIFLGYHRYPRGAGLKTAADDERLLVGERAAKVESGPLLP